MSHTVILTREASDQQRMIRNSRFINKSYILPGVVLPPQIIAITEMADITFMRPLPFGPWFPLREPCSFPTAVESVKAKPKTADASEQFANSFIYLDHLLIFIEIPVVTFFADVGCVDHV